MATELTCPKCHAPMRSYERNGIQIDQCTECRGVFLDRGELELLMDAEAAYTQAAAGGRAAAPGPVAAPPPQASQPAGYGWDQGGHHGKSGYGGHQGKRKKGFLGELFD
ncbi:TFIIB-type zinc ribbon-containing protein [Gulosibacter bifidus]|uniref:Zf-TFIIB domain-containing protein n=1 Tax=Gulosibacter bifidus TaxID=272239 RepID=A0ABW5RJU7_9MICO|nr:zf-TFIIB domain-containing protein [Gulosibacter bifidus]